VGGRNGYTRFELARDGIHAPLQVGVSGTKDEDACGVVTGLHDKKTYADRDYAREKVLEYIGTSLADDSDENQQTNLQHLDEYTANRVTLNSRGQAPTNATLSLFTSMRTGIPGWVIDRSVALPSLDTSRSRGTYTIGSTMSWAQRCSRRNFRSTAFA
jgi:hypothetical protein